MTEWNIKSIDYTLATLIAFASAGRPLIESSADTRSRSEEKRRILTKVHPAQLVGERAMDPGWEN